MPQPMHSQDLSEQREQSPPNIEEIQNEFQIYLYPQPDSNGYMPTNRSNDSNLNRSNASNSNERRASNSNERRASNSNERRASNSNERGASNSNERQASNSNERQASNLRSSQIPTRNESTVPNSNVRNNSLGNIAYIPPNKYSERLSKGVEPFTMPRISENFLHTQTLAYFWSDCNWCNISCKGFYKLFKKEKREKRGERRGKVGFFSVVPFLSLF